MSVGVCAAVSRQREDGKRFVVCGLPLRSESCLGEHGEAPFYRFPLRPRWRMEEPQKKERWPWWFWLFIILPRPHRDCLPGG